jgi:hypothetical protein
VTSKVTPIDSAAEVSALAQKLTDCKSVGDLLTLGGSDEFASVYTRATPDDQRMLREHFESLRAMLQHRVKLADIKDEIVTVLNADVKPSSVGKTGECVVLKGTRNDGSPFTLVTSAVAVLRHFSKFWNRLPAKYLFTQENVHPNDPNMSPMWNPKRIPESTGTRLPWDGGAA